MVKWDTGKRCEVRPMEETGLEIIYNQDGSLTVVSLFPPRQTGPCEWTINIPAPIND